MDMICFFEIQHYLSDTSSLGPRGCRIVENMVSVWVMRQKNLKFLIDRIMQIQQLGICYIKNSFGIRLRKDLFNFLVEVSHAHEIFFFKIVINL